MSESSKLAMKSPSLESLSSSVHTVDEIKSTEGLLFEVIEHGKIEELTLMLNDESMSTLLLQILLMKAIPNNDEKYSLDPDPSVNHLLGCSFTNLNILQLVCLLGDEDMAILLFDFIRRITLEMDSKILLLEFIHRTFGRNNTLLHLAAYLGFTHLVQRLIESGASAYARNDNNYKPIDLVDDPETSSIFNNTPSAPPRLYRGLDIPLKTISRQNIPVKLSLSGSSTPPKKKKSVKFDLSCTLLDICKHGLPKNKTISDFKTLISRCNYWEILSPQKNMSLAHVASSYGHTEILKALLEKSSNLLNQQDIEGWSPAHCASAEGNLNVLRLLGQYGPVLGEGLWDFYADNPIDLNIKTYDGESIEEVSLPENQDQIINILNELRSVQTHARTSDPGQTKKVILGSVAGALYLSKDLVIESQPSINEHLKISESSISHNLDLTDSLLAKDNVIVMKESASISASQPKNLTQSSSSLTLHEKLSIIPHQIETAIFSLQEENVTSRVTVTEVVSKDEMLPPPKSPRKPFASIATTLYKDLESMRSSEQTICEVASKPIDSRSNTFKSRNPFLQLIFGPNSEIENSSPKRNEKSDQDIFDCAKNTRVIPAVHEEYDDLRVLNIRERMRILKQLGVQ